MKNKKTMILKKSMEKLEYMQNYQMIQIIQKDILQV